MTRLGQGRSTCTVSVLIEKPNGSVFYKTWIGSNITRLKRIVRLTYAKEHPGAKVSFGSPVWTNSYGAH